MIYELHPQVAGEVGVGLPSGMGCHPLQGVSFTQDSVVSPHAREGSPLTDRVNLYVGATVPAAPSASVTSALLI